MMTSKRANRLAVAGDGKAWTRNSISIWSDLPLSAEEKKLKHPALFPQALAERVIDCWMPPDGKVVLDPFCGAGSAILAACAKDLHGIGFDISRDYTELTSLRATAAGYGFSTGSEPGTFTVFGGDAVSLLEGFYVDTVDLVITSPPYWDILTQKRTADGQETQDYAREGPHPEDLGQSQSYEKYLDGLGKVFGEVYKVLKPGSFCVVNVMDLRKKDRFYPLHMDLVQLLTFSLSGAAFTLDDLIIWDRRTSYNKVSGDSYCAECRRFRENNSGNPAPTPAPSFEGGFSRAQMIWAFNRWMDLFVENPRTFEAEFNTVLTHLKERKAGQEPSYGEISFEFMQHLLTEKNDGKTDPNRTR